MLSGRLWKRMMSSNAINENFVRVVEVGARDGLQNEKKILPTTTKIELINRLSNSGLKVVEVTSFVSPKWVPQMHDSSDVFRTIEKKQGIDYPVLVPNLEGLKSAIKVGVKEIAIFASASEAFSRKNINCSIDESLERFSSVVKLAKSNSIKIRGYVSCIAGCPYEGNIDPRRVAKLSESLLELGCYEISLGDTIGVATPNKIIRILDEIRGISGSHDIISQIAIHTHNTYGQALANVYASLEADVRIFDSSVAGLGGCPYAHGASGNLPTEDLLYLLHSQGFTTGVDLNDIIDIGHWISHQLDRDNQSKVGVAMRPVNAATNS